MAMMIKPRAPMMTATMQKDDEAQGQFDTPRKAGRDDVDAMMRFLLLAQPFFIEGLLVVDRPIFIDGLAAETIPFVIRKDFRIF